MNALDYIVIIVVLISTISGAAKGIIRSVFSFGAVLLGLVLALIFYPQLAAFYKVLGFSDGVASFLGFLTPIVVTSIAGSYLSYRIRKILKRIGLKTLDTVAGAGLGFVRAWLVCSALFLALTAFPGRLQVVEHAQTKPFLYLGARLLTSIGSKDLAVQFERGIQELQKLKTGANPGGDKPDHTTPHKK